MESIFSWFGRLMETLGSFIPSWHHLECTDLGVTITRGKKVKALKPGLIFYWPFWTSLYYRPANIQTVPLPTQPLMTKDQKTLAVGGMVRYRLVDPIKALVETDTVSSAIEDEALAAVCYYITDKTLDELLSKDRQTVNKELTAAVRKELVRYGVRTERAQLIGCSTCLTLNHVGTFWRNGNGNGGADE